MASLDPDSLLARPPASKERILDRQSPTTQPLRCLNAHAMLHVLGIHRSAAHLGCGCKNVGIVDTQFVPACKFQRGLVNAHC